MSTARAIILAAGKGTRMKSRVPKVLHELCGRTMFEHVLHAVRDAGISDILAVVNADLRAPIEAFGVRTLVQEPQNGTGHAAQLAMAALAGDDPVLIVSADMPLLPARTARVGRRRSRHNRRRRRARHRRRAAADRIRQDRALARLGRAHRRARGRDAARASGRQK